jgi:hypothetical protein
LQSWRERTHDLLQVYHRPLEARCANFPEPK